MTDNLSISQGHEKVDWTQKIGLTLAGFGILVLLISWGGVVLNATIFLPLSMFAILVGTAIYGHRSYMKIPAGIKNNSVYFNSLTNKGAIGWVVAIVLTGFYVFLYKYPTYLGYQAGVDGANAGLIALFDPLSIWINGNPASQWFVYGTIYTLVILSLGIKFIYKYRHNRYQQIRTWSVMGAQLVMAYTIPQILAALNYNDARDEAGKYIGYYDTDIKNIWPLDYDFFQSWHLDAMQQSAYQPVGMIFLVVGIALAVVGVPVITYFFGKRWYCSWVCGCGGLAETAGDPFRHLSDKSTNAWFIERWMIHGVMVFVVIMTGLVLADYLWDFKFSETINRTLLVGIVTAIIGGIVLIQRKKSKAKKIPMMKILVIAGVVAASFAIYILYPQIVEGASSNYKVSTNSIKSWYGFFIGATFSGIIGVGFYPLMGNRVWCRFGCPLAGYLGLVQRFKSKFRITTNGGQCISCGNCSTYCEQGIDVRAYAQRGQNIVRSSCVGCGICSAVCPRGVLKLENGPEKGRFND